MVKHKKRKKEENYLQNAYEELNSGDIETLIKLVLDRKSELYHRMKGDLDFSWTIDNLEDTEKKLRNLFVNLLQNGK